MGVECSDASINGKQIRRTGLSMKIGISTFTHGDNYGQRLQNLAVQETLKLSGADVLTFRQEDSRSIKYRFNKFLALIPKGLAAASLGRHRAFQDFDFLNIAFSREVISDSRPPRNMGSYDFFVAGSDQVWSPYSPDANSTMFLAFAPREKRIAFSPSLAAPTIPEEKRELFYGYLNGFDRLSVREQKSADLIRDLYGLKADVLIDPTLMFDGSWWEKYEKIPAGGLPDNYVLTYFLGSAAYEDRVNEICNELGCARVDLLGDKRYYAFGPAEFLYAIHHAKLVATDSYHGSIFSILFDRPLVYCPRESSGPDMSSRFDTLASNLGISFQKRSIMFVRSSDVLDADYSGAFSKLADQRNKVVDYFEKCGLSLSTEVDTRG